MNPTKIVVAATAFACVALLTLAGAQAATHPHHMHVATHHHGHHGAVAAGAEVATDGAAAVGTASAVTLSGYYAPSEWGDFECRPGFPGCRPYASKDWSVQ